MSASRMQPLQAGNGRPAVSAGLAWATACPLMVTSKPWRHTTAPAPATTGLMSSVLARR
ncbi:MAG TPA: hypothetical protein VH475_29720 [Tepidisphaeraceae bacterium]